MFDSLTAWQWVVLAWAEVIVVYAGYLLYLRSRRARLQDDPDAHGPESRGR